MEKPGSSIRSTHCCGRENKQIYGAPEHRRLKAVTVATVLGDPSASRQPEETGMNALGDAQELSLRLCASKLC
jgi:hypothetical protein